MIINVQELSKSNIVLTGHYVSTNNIYEPCTKCYKLHSTRDAIDYYWILTVPWRANSSSCLMVLGDHHWRSSILAEFRQLTHDGNVIRALLHLRALTTKQFVQQRGLTTLKKSNLCIIGPLWWKFHYGKWLFKLLCPRVAHIGVSKEMKVIDKKTVH